MSNKILIIDDDMKLRNLLREYLEGYNHDVLTLGDSLQASQTVRSESPDMVILDIMMPHKDGLEVLREIRAVSRVPVIMLTAKGEDADRIVGLELGADDYLPKPFNPRELLARMKAVWRRIDRSVSASSKEERITKIKAGGLILDQARLTLHSGEKKIALSSTEYRILEVLMQNANKVLSRDQLMNMAQGKDYMVFDRSIDVHISKLRSKLETDPRSPQRIKTIWGAGYMFVDSW